MTKRPSYVVLLATLCLSAISVQADIAYYTQGGTLTGSPDYDWWYGCSPTSAGMMMGHYDIHGYGGLLYDNLVPGGVAETSTYYSTAGNWQYLAQSAIASPGHVADYFGDGGAGDALGSGRTLPDDYDCLADFMGTSQGTRGDGSTSFGYYPNGNPLYEASSAAGEGMYGMGLYAEYAGYDAANLYSQLLPGVADDIWKDGNGDPIYAPNTNGFTWGQYVAEIDAGRPVMIHVDGHSMYGYGYDDVTTEVILHDTWSPGEHRMAWGGSYSSRLHYGVTVLELTGGTPIPVPAAALLGMLGLGVAGMKLRKYV